MSQPPPRPTLRIRVIFRDGEMMGPGKADLLELIDRTGSIAAAGRDMDMSYKRAWMLIETLNAMFKEPLVTRTRGGPRGGGASLTPMGRAVLEEYRAIGTEAAVAAETRLERLRALLADLPDG